MSGTFLYLAYDGSWSVDLGQSAVRLGAIPGFTELAELGAVGSSSLPIDDPTATAGHSSDGFLAYQQFQYSESLASVPVVFRGWTKETRYSRAPGTSLITGAARRIDLTLEDANTLAGRRVIAPADVDATVKRPSETCAARISWLLGTAYFSGVADNGLVHPATATLNANDYSGSHPADVLNDVCTLTGDNWFVYWDRTAAAWSLAVFNMTTYDGWTGTLLLSNDLARIDSNLDGLWTAGPTNCWAVDTDAVLVRDSSRICTGVYYAYAKGTVLRTATSTTYPRIDLVSSSTAVKTAGQATTKADRYLAESDAPADRITCTARIGAANVNDALAGQLISASFTHLPPYDTLSYFRIARRSVLQAELTDQFYTVEYELVPAAPAEAQYTFGALHTSWEEDVFINTGEKMFRWKYNGDQFGWPKQGLIDYDDTGGHAPEGQWTALKVLGSGTVNLYAELGWHVLWDGGTVNYEIRQNGTVVASTTWVDPDPTPLHNVNRRETVSATGISCSTGDIFQAWLSWSSTPDGGGVNTCQDNPFTITGYLVP